MSDRIESLEWDEFNRDHIQKHGVTRNEVEEVCFGSRYVFPNRDGRLKAIGYTSAGRLLTVNLARVFEFPGTFYTVSARPASRAERRAFSADEKGQPQ